MYEFIAALRQLQRPLVTLAAAILVVQTLVAGLASGDTAARIAIFGPDAAFCHPGSGDGSTPAKAAAHECCVSCTNAGPVVLAASAPVIDRLVPAHRAGQADIPADVRPQRRAIRAGPSQAPPTTA